MSHKLPQIKAREIIRIAKKLGFEFDRQSGSHAVYYRKSDKSRIVVPVHPGKDIKPKTLFGIIKDMGMESDEFKKFL
ncbi:MAG: type II toxin-antitoxin system HicA family toxin [Candidatus Latescibacteria bacterium]|nr:type II toxin-antitoxin system HicA family toxin [Candidatus Latescibacterota bacterium]